MTFAQLAPHGGAHHLLLEKTWKGGEASRLFRAAREGAEELLWPTRCVGCGLPGELLCEECRAKMPWIAQRWACPACGAPFGHIICTECERNWEPRATVCACSFEGPAARLVTCLKDGHELRLAPVVAAAMAGALEEAEAWPAADGTPRAGLFQADALCFVPATSEAYARRGFDHMELVSRELSRLTGVPLADVLVRDAARDQRSLGKEERASNLRGTVGVTDDVSGMHLLLADDVITTGSSVREAARALLERGAASVTACSLARVW